MIPHVRTSSARFIAIAALLFAAIGCATPAASPPPQQLERATEPKRRSFAPKHDGEPIIAGISYGPYREGQRPGGPDPTPAQLEEDLRIIAQHWNMLRVYGSRGPTEAMLRIIKDNDLPIVVVVGAWIDPEDEAANRAEVEAAIRLANDFPSVVAAVSIGNETQVFWSGHRTPTDTLIGWIRTARDAIQQPVTTADDYNFWNKPESHAVAAEVDFILLHAYAMWNQQSLDNAVAWTAEIVESIEAEHPTKKVVLGETGWATELNPEGDETKYITAPAGEAEQRKFYREFVAWAAESGQPYFFFEAFDEPWKGSDDPREVEKHWGLYNVDRTPKPVLEAD